LGFLKLNADALAELVGVVAPIQAKQLNGALIGGGQAFTHFNGGSLPCSVGAEEAETFSTRNFEVDAVDGLDVGEGFADAAEEQGRAGGGGFGGW